MISLFSKKPAKGLLAFFTDPEQLKKAAADIKPLGLKKVEAFTPFPIHGLEKILGYKKSFIPWVTLTMGLGGAGLGFFFQAWMSAIDWPINVGGKPFLSWPSFIPITFETGVLLAGVSSVLAFFVACGLPNRKSAPLDESFTNDRFGLYFEESDPKFEAEKIKEICNQCQAEKIVVIGK